MYKVYTENVDGRRDSFILEDYDGEASDLFKEADREAEEEVEVLYTPDSMTGEDLELWRQDWMI